MPLDPKLLKFSTASPILVNYSYTDIITGRGVFKLYALNSEDNTAKSYHLMQNVTFSNDVLTVAAGAQALTQVLDLDFDTLPLESTLSLKGILTAQISLQCGHETTASVGTTAYVVIKVRKWDGTTETEIASNTSSDSVVAANLTIVAGTVTTTVNIATETVFVPGDMLRLTVEVWATGSANGSRAALLHDPINRIPALGTSYGYGGGAEAITTVAETSQTLFEIPFLQNQ